MTPRTPNDKQVTATHALCDECYAGLADVGAARVDPVRLRQHLALRELCCSCGRETLAGLYLETAVQLAWCDHDRQFAQH